MKKLLIASSVVLTLIGSPALAWESYEFDVSYIRVTHNFCQIGIKNLSQKSGNDAAICDSPTAIVFSDCLSEQSKMKINLALAAKLAGKRMTHQAIAQQNAAPCTVGPYQLGIVD